MNKLSDVLIELTKEVLNICEENGIPCVLADETVYQMMRNEGDLDKLQSVYLVVKADDLDKLYECLNKTNIPNRGVESMKNNDFYPDFSMRYVNLETTCSMDKDGFMYPAIGIFIVPIRKKIKKLQRTYFYRLEHWTLGNGRKLYPQLLSLYKLGYNKTGIMRGMKRKGCNYQVSEFSGNNILSVQGMEFPISSLNSNRKKFSYGISQFVAYDTVYSFVQNGLEIKERKGSKNLFVNFLKELWKRISKRIWKRIYPITQDWDKINCVNEQNLLELEYEQKKPLIRELYKNKEFGRLQKELLPYHKKLLYYFTKCKLTIVFDEEIFNIYKEVYGKANGKKYIKKITRRIPKVWRNK